MAQIDLQRKDKGGVPGWVWGILLVGALVLVGLFFWPDAEQEMEAADVVATEYDVVRTPELQAEQAQPEPGLVPVGEDDWMETEPLGDQRQPATREGEQQPEATPGGPTATSPGAASLPLAEILNNPTDWTGKTIEGEIQVGEAATDRGFWVEHEGNRMLAILVDRPREVPIDIKAGQKVRISQATVRDTNTDLDALPGVTLDDDTRRLLEQQKAFLLVNEKNIEILAR